MFKPIKSTLLPIATVGLLVFSMSAMAATSSSSNDALSLTPVDNTDTTNNLSQRAPNPNLLFAQPNVLQREAFRNVTRQAMPMTPDQITQMKKMLAATQLAASTSAVTPPKPVTSSKMVSLAPGATPPVIDLQKGFISSLVFVDSAGNKWPIVGYDLGDPSAFNIQWQQGSNTLLVQANSMYTYGNLAVTLKGTSTPVMLTLVPGQSEVDYRVDLHVQGQSPDALPTVGETEPGQASNTLLNILNGIAPDKAKALTVTGGPCVSDLNNCQAWQIGKNLYLRLPNEVLSPSWMSSMQSSDGMHAYLLQKTPNVLVSNHGQSEQVNIGGY